MRFGRHGSNHPPGRRALMKRTQSVLRIYGKRWYFIVASLLLGSLAAFSLIMGPLFLLGVAKRVDGSEAFDAGIALTIFGCVMLPIAFLAAYNAWVRRKPVITVDSEGIAIWLIGASSLDGVPLLPGWIRTLWSVFSGQGFRKQMGWIPWERFHNVAVVGNRIQKSLYFYGDILYPDMSQDGSMEVSIGHHVAFADSELKRSVEDVRDDILEFAEIHNARFGPGDIDANQGHIDGNPS
jgi:hypothetical protein